MERTIRNSFNKAYSKFPYKIKKPSIKVVSKKEFVKHLKKSLLKIHPDATPALISHTPKKDTILYCKETIKKLADCGLGKFVEAVTMHELYHEWNRHKVDSEEEAVLSEVLVDEEMKKEFPELDMALENTTKKLIKKRKKRK